MDPERQELATLVAAVRAHLQFAQAAGTPGIPELPVPAAAPEIVSPAGSRARPPAAPQARTDASPGAALASPDLVPPDLSPEARVARLRAMAREAAECTDCVLHERRNRNVFARGNPAADLVFVGEGPGRDEDRQGLPFVGAAGQLLDKMVAAMGFGQDEIYICNVVKCRPPDNRKPRPEESLACARFLRPQLGLVRPRVIVALGRCAAEALGAAPPQGSWRGRWGSYGEVPVMPTYHPAFLLRSPEFKRVVWQDLQLVMGRMGKSDPRRGRG